MKRADKYPDTLVFHWHNANPRGRLTEDCVVRAISTACEKPYEQVVTDLAQVQIETGYAGTGQKGVDELLRRYGWEKHKQPRKEDNTKYTGQEFCEMIQNERKRGALWAHGVWLDRNIICNIGGHHIVAVIDGKVWDTWDSTRKCIGNYWIKP